MKRLLLVVLTALLALSCQKNEPATAASTAAPDPHAGTDSSAVGAVEAMSNAGSLDTADLRYDLPAGWTRQMPSSSMRLDQAVIPGPGGEGQLAVFFFGVGGGGGVDANLERWAAQVQHDGQPARDSFEVNGFRISTIEVRGTILPSGMGGPSEPQPDSVLLGAVVEGTGGPWFFKATGPRATMDPAKEPFLGMLRTVRANL